MTIMVPIEAGSSNDQIHVNIGYSPMLSVDHPFLKIIKNEYEWIIILKVFAQKSNKKLYMSYV